MGKKCPKNIFSYILVALSFAAVAIFNVNVLFVIIACAVSGVGVALASKGGADK